MVPSTPVSLVKFAARLASVSTGWSSSTPTRDQVPQEMYAKSRPRAGTATTADAVSCEPTAITGSGPPGRPGPSPASPGSAASSGRRVPITRAGLAQRREQPGGQAGPPDQVPRPVPGPGVVQLGGGRVGHLGADLTGQPVGEQVGDQQQGPRRGQLRRPRLGGELVDRVDGQLLDPGHRVQVRRRDLGQHVAHHAVGPAVPVVHRVAEQGPARAEQAVVHAPRVDARAGQLERAGRRAQPVQHPAVQAQDVPVQRAQHPDRRVREPVRLVQLELARGRPTWPTMTRPPDAPRSTAATAAPAFAALRSVAPRRPGTRAAAATPAAPGPQRRNAAATPASTGMCSPVVRARSPPVSATTAAATCSGSTSRFSRVRCA